MRFSSKPLAAILIALFLSLSFNAYACLVPIFDSLQVSQAKDCAMPGEEPVSQFCDGFKTLALQSGADVPSPIFFHLVMSGNIFSLATDPHESAQFLSTSQKADLIFPKNRLPLLSVFRI